LPIPEKNLAKIKTKFGRKQKKFRLPVFPQSICYKNPAKKGVFALKNRQKENLIQSRQNSIICKPLAMPAFGKQTIFPLFRFFCIWAGAANAQNSSHAIRQFFEQKILRKNNKKVMYKILVCFV
jgi:hypothetical protein